MSKIAYAVIGANYGDEGKGLTTDYLCSLAQPPVTVVRFNGGAQAGHTVQTTAARHVFHHYGSGSFLDANTYLSRHFICNPIMFAEERQKFLGGGEPNFFVNADPRCLVTTPWDMMINQIVETRRGLNRHGSCGIGINETVVRNENTKYAFTLEDGNKLPAASCELIQREWVWFRLAQLGIKEYDLTGEELENLASQAIRTKYLSELEDFVRIVQVVKPECYQASEDTIIFEGAQGLALDQDFGDFPHVTRSNTGLKNVEEVCHEMGINEVKAVYVTRPYLTRHGAGPLPNEISALSEHWKFSDATNVSNRWQGMLRFAELDIQQMCLRIRRDVENVRGLGLKVSPTIMVTCTDQIPGGGYFTYWNGDDKLKTGVEEFLGRVREQIGASPEELSYVSAGPTRYCVEPLISESNLTETATR